MKACYVLILQTMMENMIINDDLQYKTELTPLTVNGR